MDRRLLNYFLAAAVFVSMYMALNAMFPPPQPPNAAGDVANQDGDAEGGNEAVDPNSESAPPGDTEANDAAGAIDQIRTRSNSWTTLGSMAADSGYRMLVTFNARGGGVERIELTERKLDGQLKYRRVDVRSGYLGYLAPGLSSEEPGVLVNVVGPGTPAAMARALDGSAVGLQVGDVIVGIGNAAVESSVDLEALLLETKPGDKITIEVIRGAGSEDSVRQSFEVELTEHPLDLVRAASTGGADQILGNLDRSSCLLTLSQLQNKSIRSGQREITSLLSQHGTVWESVESPEDDAVSYRLELPEAVVKQAGGTGPIELRRAYRLSKESYHLDMDVTVRNQSESPQKLAYRLEGANGVTLEGWWYSTKISPNFSGAAARDFVYNTDAEARELVSAYSLLKHAKKNPEAPEEVIFAPDSEAGAKTLRYIGVDAQYFSVSFVPKEGQERLDQFGRAAGTLVADPSLVPDNQERATNVSFFVDSEVQEVPPGGEIHHQLRMFAGPKQPHLLEQYGLVETLEYGWFWWIARPLSGLLHVFNAIVGNYALAIIMLTLLVRGCMFPLSRKAAIHAQKMQELAPELKKITEKYKDDFEKRLKAQRELQQRVGFNPLSGCLPMFVQLPIFIGLYRALSVDIELRQAALSSKIQWASNLAAPDMLYYWGDWLWDYLSGRGTGWLGPYFNILPLLVVALFLTQQKMFMPPATDEQTAMTQKVMTVMTMFMGLFFFRVPSGLCVYFITSSLWGIIERKAVKKMVPKGPQLNLGTDAIDVSDSSTTAPAKASGRKSFADRIKEAAGIEEERKPVVPPNKRKRPPKKR